jgi:hypothetical protein
VPLANNSTMPQSLPTHTYDNLTFSNNELELSYGTGGTLSLSSAEISTLTAIASSTNLKPYIVLSIGNVKLNSASIDFEGKKIKFENIPSNLSGKPATLYIEEIKYTEYTPNIGNIDYDSVLWRLVSYGVPKNKNLGKYNINIFSIEQQMGLPILK